MSENHLNPSDHNHFFSPSGISVSLSVLTDIVRLVTVHGTWSVLNISTHITTISVMRLIKKSWHFSCNLHKGHSTTMYTTVMKEVVSHYTWNESFLYGYLLDATKGFDRGNYGKLLSFCVTGIFLVQLFTFYLIPIAGSMYVFAGIMFYRLPFTRGTVLNRVEFCLQFFSMYILMSCWNAWKVQEWGVT